MAQPREAAGQFAASKEFAVIIGVEAEAVGKGCVICRDECMDASYPISKLRIEEGSPAIPSDS